MLSSLVSISGRTRPVIVTVSNCVQLQYRGRRRPSVPLIFRSVPEEWKVVSQLSDLDLTEIKPQYRHVKELENASEDVRKVFSLGFGSKEDLLEAKLQQYAKQLQRHAWDYESKEMQIANLTVKLRSEQEYGAQTGYRDKMRRKAIPRLAKARNSLLLELRKERYDRYALVMKVLNLNVIFEPQYDLRLTKRAKAIADMETRVFAEAKLRKDDRARRKVELAKVQAEIEEKLKSGELSYS